LTPSSAPDPVSGPVSRRRLVAGLAAFAVLIAGFSALGVWQVQRLAWKQELIRQVDSRIHADPVPAPGPADFDAVTRETDQYRRVTTDGRFLHDREVRVKAVTDLGPGFWVVTPLEDARGFTVLINRGFVPAERAASETRAEGQVEGLVSVTGLLRISERPLVLARRGGDRAGQAVERPRRPLFHRRGCDAQSGRVAARRVDGGAVRQQPSGLRPDLVRPGADVGGRCGAVAARRTTP